MKRPLGCRVLFRVGLVGWRPRGGNIYGSIGRPDVASLVLGTIELVGSYGSSKDGVPLCARIREVALHLA